MLAFIPAAGLGTRLGQLTSDKPKALVPILGKPMIDFLIQRLTKEGFTHFVVNLHHYADILEEHLRRLSPRVSIDFSCERNLLLDTGGAITHAAEKLRKAQHFLVHNVDVVLPVSTTEIFRQHVETGAMVTVAVSERKSSRKLLFDAQNRLCGWKNDKTGELKKAANYTENHRALAYSGVQWTSRNFFDVEKRDGKFSIIDSWLNICADYPIVAFEHPCDGWFDLGTPENIVKAEQFLKNQNPTWL